MHSDPLLFENVDCSVKVGLRCSIAPVCADWAYGRKYLNMDLLEEWVAERRAHPQDLGPRGELPLKEDKEITVA